jgi:hypothetical protein
MSTPDSVPSVVLPVVPRLTVVPRPVSGREIFRAEFAKLPAPVVGGAGAVLILTVWAFSSKLVAVDLSSLIFTDTTESARLLGSASFLTIVLIAGAIAGLHRALRATRATERAARQVALIALAGAYLHLVLWLSRVVAGAMTAVASGSLAAFMPSVFWWG